MKPERDKEFQKRLLATFKAEAEEHIQALSSGLVELERAAPGEERRRLVENVFREAHSLKGAARAVGLASIEQICHASEDVFSALQRGALELAPGSLAALHDAVDTLGALLAAADDAPAGKAAAGVPALLARLQAIVGAKPAAATPGEAPPALEAPEKPASAGTVRIPTARLDALLFQAEELLSAKLAGAQHAADARAAASALGAWKKSRSGGRAGMRTLQRMLRGPATKLGPLEPKLRRLAELIERDEELMKSLEGRVNALARSAEEMQRGLGAAVEALLEDVKKALMLPAASALAVFPKLVRDVCREQGKEAELLIQGADIEVDRRILEELRDPLMHLIRNCVDHGIEPPQERVGRGKPGRGTIRLEIARKSEATIEIMVRDDGAGIDAGKVAAAAQRLGLASAAEAGAGDAGALLPLIFSSGLSTRASVTDISGRGLGLAIVREKVERLGGGVLVESERGRGTSFRLVLPITLATFRGVHVRAAGRRFVLPTAQVEQVLSVGRSAIRTVGNRETIEWQGRAVSLAPLAHVLGIASAPSEAPYGDKTLALIAGTPEGRMAFAVDDVLEEREVLVKPLGKQLARVRNISGACVLGSGELVALLDVPDLLRSAAQTAPRPAVKGEPRARRKTVLVAEDSITSRTLLKAILEASGYEVWTAVDGAEALALLKKQRFDAVVSDVDMPRMNGFELTAEIRGDGALSALPVVLVTSLDSREHREKGIDAGASAYIVKQSFDQGNLLGALGRLL